MPDPSPSDHYEARPDADAAVAPGVYRVVGTDEPVALLRITDGEGKRRATGEVVRVSRDDLSAVFERTQNPDAGIDPVRSLRNLASGVVWSVRRFLPF